MCKCCEGGSNVKKDRGDYIPVDLLIEQYPELSVLVDSIATAGKVIVDSVNRVIILDILFSDENGIYEFEIKSRAKCNPVDVFDINYGVKLAVSRLMVKFCMKMAKLLVSERDYIENYLRYLNSLDNKLVKKAKYYCNNLDYVIEQSQVVKDGKQD